jgi:hypothetical protein
MLSMEATMDNDTLITIAEKICQLWTACGGYGPPHEFKVLEWARGTTKIQVEHKLSSEQWCEAHQAAVKMGARAHRGGVGANRSERLEKRVSLTAQEVYCPFP